jgi:hypothetical protein
MRIWLLEIDALDDAGAEVTLRYSSAEYRGEAPFEVRVRQPALYTIRASGLPFGGGSRSGFGEAVLVNKDGGLDFLADYAVDGRECRLTLYSETETFAESDAWAVLAVDGDGNTLAVDGDDNELLVDASSTYVFFGTVTKLVDGDGTLSVRLRDFREALSEPHPHNVYAGTNSLPSGVEGVEADIKGRMKPRVYGSVSNATPVLVNTARLIYQFHDGGSVVVTALRDRGVVLTDDGEQASLTALELATSPDPGHYIRFQGYVRLGAIPTGEVTGDIESTIATQAGDVFSLIAGEAGYSIVSGEAAAINDAGVVGLHITNETPTADLLDRITRSIGGYWAITQSGELTVRRLFAPYAPSVLITDAEIISMTRSATGTGDNGLPIWRVIVQGDRVETVQNEVAATAPASIAARVSAQYRQAIDEDPSVKYRHPLASELTIEGVLRDLDDCADVAERLGDLFGVRRDIVEVTARLEPNVLEAIRLGTEITVRSYRYGYTQGRDFIVLGHTLDARLGRATLFLWG